MYDWLMSPIDYFFICFQRSDFKPPKTSTRNFNFANTKLY